MTTYSYKGKDYRVWENRKGYSCVVLPVGGRNKAFLMHRLIWEQAHGLTPSGHDVHHIDGDRANWQLDNLQLIERTAHQRMHRQTRSTKNSISREEQALAA